MLDSLADGLAVKWNEKIVLKYQFNSGGVRPYWHPLKLPNSPVLTMDRPPDHIHHQGMWLAWKKVNGVNFWEQPSGEDWKGFGKIAHKKIVSHSTQLDDVQFIVENSWLDWNGNEIVKDIRKTKVYRFQGNYLLMDVDLRFIPSKNEVKLDLNRGTPGKGGLFYSGLTIRFDNLLTPGQLLDANGESEPMEIFGKKSPWCGFSGKHKDGEVYGITVIDHPENPRYPTPWWVRNAKNYALLQPSFCYYEPFSIIQEEPLSLIYRVVIHKGPVKSSLIEKVGF